MKEIELNDGHKALVDDEDYEFLNQFRWYYQNGYAVKNTKTCWLPVAYMHRIVARTPPHLMSDHINGNRLDNRRCNLRNVTDFENQRNTRKVKTSGLTSKYKGVNKLRRKAGGWRAYICINRKQIRLGIFETEEDAARAYDAAAKKYFGQYARPNFIE